MNSASRLIGVSNGGRGRRVAGIYDDCYCLDGRHYTHARPRPADFAGVFFPVQFYGFMRGIRVWAEEICYCGGLSPGSGAVKR